LAVRRAHPGAVGGDGGGGSIVGSSAYGDAGLEHGRGGRLTPVKTAAEPLIVPRSSETALDRARVAVRVGPPLRCAARGRSRTSDDPLRPEADKLKAEIQLELLAYQTSPGGAELTKP
jgi:hypothetical protein